MDGPAARWGAVIGALAALPAMLWLWGFTVDDALISARYAHHLATGAGYRFNPEGPVTDGVTPLGWAHLLAIFGRGSVWETYRAAKWIGAVSWLGGACVLGGAVTALPGARRRVAALTLVLVSAPLGAWAVAGMETGVVMGLGAAAVSARVVERRRWAAGLAGVVAAWRPEAALWALCLALGPSRQGATTARDRAVAAALAWGPAAGVALVRLAVFGRVVPLSAWAKTPVPALGARYAVAAFLVAGGIAALWPKAPAWVRGLQAAVGLHFLGVALAGGDWMPLARLSVVVVPTVVVIAAERLSQPGHWRWAPLGLALLVPGYTAYNIGPRAAGVEQKRRATMEAAREPLREASRVATLDVGWVGAVHPGEVIDLAGVTDPTVAVLPGGHTSKRVPRALVGRRDVDTFVLLAAGPPGEPWTDTRWSRWVEAHVAHMPEVAEDFRPIARLTPLTYVVVRRAIDRPGAGE